MAAVAAALLGVGCTALFLVGYVMCTSPVFDTVYDISRDGRLVAYASRDRSVLIIGSLADGKPLRTVEDFTLIDSVVFGHRNDVVFISAARSRGSYPSLYRVTAEGARLLYQGSAVGGITSLVASRDGRVLLFLEATKKQGDLFGGSFPSGWVLKQFSVTTGAVRQLTADGQFPVPRPAFSSDDSLVALPGSGRVLLINRREGRTKEVSVPHEFPGDCVFSADGRSLYYVFAEHTQATPRLVRVDVVTGEAVTIGTLPKGATALRGTMDPWRLFCVVDSVPWTPPTIMEVNPETAETKELLRLEEP